MYEGRLIRLRAFERHDVDANHAFVNDYETVCNMFSGIPFPSSMEDEYRWIDQQTSYSRGEYQFAIEDYEGSMVGRCGLTRVDWKNRVAELAIMVGTPYRRRGYAADAMEVLCRFCFEEMNLNKLKVSVFAFNTAAVTLYEKCGFVREGLLKSEIFRAGKYQDVVLMARFRE